jgi:hypothetical protein
MLTPDRKTGFGGLRRDHHETEGPVLVRVRPAPLRPASEERILGDPVSIVYNFSSSSLTLRPYKLLPVKPFYPGLILAGTP